MNGFRSAAAIIALTVIGASGFLIMPVILAASVQEFNLSDKEVGFLAALSMTGAAVIAVSALFWVRAVNWRCAALTGLLVQGCGYALATQAQGFSGAGIAFLLVSLGGGAVYSLAITTLSDHRQPERLFGYSITLQVAFQVAGMLLLVRYATPGRFDELMLCLACLSGTGLLFAFHIPGSGKETPAFSFNGLFRQRKALLALCGCLFFFFNVGCIWAYLERIGSAAGFSAQALGNGLALGVSVGMVGALTASWQGARAGRVIPLVIGAIGTVIAVAALVPEVNLAIFVLALALYNFVWNYSLAYQYAVVAAADHSGRCIAAAPAFHAAGGAIGPAVAAILIAPGSFLVVNVLAATSVLISLVLLLPAARLTGKSP